MKNSSSRRETVLVTGSSRGLGRAICQQFAASSYRVAVHCYRNRAAADETLRSLAGAGHAVVSGPIAAPGEARAVLASSVEQLGTVDVLVNNAGVYFDHPPLATSLDEWGRAWNEMLGAMLLG